MSIHQKLGIIGSKIENENINLRKKVLSKLIFLNEKKTVFEFLTSKINFESMTPFEELSFINRFKKKSFEYSQVPNKRVYLLKYCNVELLAMTKAKSSTLQ